MKRTQRRMAFTLVELLVVMAILSTVMGISVTLMFSMFDFQQRYAEQSEQIRSTNRFVEQFRSDAQLCYTLQLEPNDETLLQWADGDNIITYSLVPGKFPEKREIVRRVMQGDKLIGTEVYHLPDYAAVQFVMGQDANAGLLALSLWEQPPGSNVFTAEELDPFTRTLLNPQPDSPNPGDAIHWRSVIVRIATSQETGGTP